MVSYLMYKFILACGINLHKKCVYDSTPFCTKVRHNHSHHDTSNIINSTHSHMAQCRSAQGRATISSFGGHYKNSNVAVPHTFMFHKFIAPTQCDLCGRTVSLYCRDFLICYTYNLPLFLGQRYLQAGNAMSR